VENKEDNMTINKYFSVSKHPNDEKPSDIYFGVNEENDKFPEHIIELKNDFEQFIIIITSVFKNDVDLFNSYYSRVYSLADLAFNSTKDQSVLAQKSLDKLKNEIVVAIGPRIRSQFLFDFCKHASIPFIMSILVVFFGDKLLALANGVGIAEGTYFLGKLGLVAIGALVGGWLSIATATRTIAFNDIIPIINNRMGILARVLFIMTFGVSFAVIMISGVLKINLGGLDSTQITNNSAIALSFGLIIGFAEKIFVEKFEAKLSRIKL
jgi:hypothetical protein